MTSKRLGMLEKMTGDGAKDPFVWYALALEYSGAGRIDEALATFVKLRDIKSDYVPMYLMCGSMLATAGRRDEARHWLTEGVTVARVAGDQHALGEIETALAALPNAGN